MKKEMRDKWCAALRSGEYKQCKEVLRVSKGPEEVRGHCCLGVLCEMSGLPWETTRPLPHLPEGYDWVPSGFSMQNDSLGVSASDKAALASMNDNGKSFAEIADWIEANIPVGV